MLIKAKIVRLQLHKSFIKNYDWSWEKKIQVLVNQGLVWVWNGYKNARGNLETKLQLADVPVIWCCSESFISQCCSDMFEPRCSKVAQPHFGCVNCDFSTTTPICHQQIDIDVFSVLPWWSSREDSKLPMWRAWVQVIPCWGSSTCHAGEKKNSSGLVFKCLKRCRGSRVHLIFN